MARITDRVRQALAAAGAKLKRTKKHLVYELPNGRTVVVSSTPGDPNSDWYTLRDIRAAADVPRKPTVVSAPKEKRRKPGRQESKGWSLPSDFTPMAEAFRQSGLVEQQLRSQIRDLEETIKAKEAQITELEGLAVVRCWRFIHSMVRAARRRA